MPDQSKAHLAPLPDAAQIQAHFRQIPGLGRCEFTYERDRRSNDQQLRLHIPVASFDNFSRDTLVQAGFDRMDASRMQLRYSEKWRMPASEIQSLLRTTHIGDISLVTNMLREKHPAMRNADVVYNPQTAHFTISVICAPDKYELPKNVRTFERKIVVNVPQRALRKALGLEVEKESPTR